MREIKFRAWDEQHNRMLGPYGIEEWHLIYVKYMTEHGRVTPLQYTGLKDKNGKEIYEGDILNFDPALYGDNMPQFCVVEWSDYRGGWKVVGGIQAAAFWALVAGNIYENPELLEK